MPQITKISPQKKRKRVNIFIDEKFAFGLDLETLSKYNLQVDQEISQKEIKEIIKEEELLKAYDKALRFLSFRPRSEKEIKDYLKKKKIGEETQKMVLKKLKKANFLDDREFTLWWIEQRMTFRPSGKRLLEYELRKKGVDKEIIEEFFATGLYPSFEFKMALKAAKKKFSSYQKLPGFEFRKKITAFLARRGFSWEVIKEVIESLNKSLSKEKTSRS